MQFLGVDLGATGALVLVEDDKILQVQRMPFLTSTKQRKPFDVSALRDIVRPLGHRRDDVKVWAEDVQWFEDPKKKSSQSGGRAFTFGYCSGVIISAFELLGLEVNFVKPQVWKKELGLIGKTKAASIQLANDLFPGAGIDNDDVAEAALLAKYGMLKK